MEVLAHEKSRSWEAAPAQTGMVRVTRAVDDGWQAEGWSRLSAHAWPLTAGIERCKWIKAFGSATEHAREVNWLMGSLQRYLAAGLSISMDPSEIVFGYAELPPRVARLNGAEWAGYVYRVNLSIQDLLAVVDWSYLKDQEEKSPLASELRLDKGIGQAWHHFEFHPCGLARSSVSAS